MTMKMRQTTSAQTFMRFIKAGLILAGACFLEKGSAVNAFANREWPLEEKVNKSDLIVVGRVLDTKVHKVPMEVESVGTFLVEDHTATVLVTATIKGRSSQKITVDYAGPAPEDHPDCCIPGNEYVFFLERTHDDTYVLVNQRYGIYRIAPASELPTDGTGKP